MPVPMLKTKLHIPRVRSDLVHRPGLMERLTGGLDRKLTLISAPAGYGKTTLLSMGIGCCDRPVAWITLDREDNDPNSFLSYLIAALHGLFAKIRDQGLSILLVRRIKA